MARHASPRNPAVRRTLVALATTGAALAAGAATASADSAPVLDGAARPASLGHTDPQVVIPVGGSQFQHPSDDRLGRQQAFAQLALEFPRSEERAQHLAVRPKDAPERGVKFPFDASGMLIQLGQRLLERVP